jgi:hypothetical protein
MRSRADERPQTRARSVPMRRALRLCRSAHLPVEARIEAEPKGLGPQ